MLVPAMLPTASAPLPSPAATTPTASSGKLVPIETTVRPMTIGLMPNRPASPTPPRTITSAPTTSAANPARNQRTFVVIISFRSDTEDPDTEKPPPHRGGGFPLTYR